MTVFIPFLAAVLFISFFTPVYAADSRDNFNIIKSEADKLFIDLHSAHVRMNEARMKDVNPAAVNSAIDNYTETLNKFMKFQVENKKYMPAIKPAFHSMPPADYMPFMSHPFLPDHSFKHGPHFSAHNFKAIHNYDNLNHKPMKHTGKKIRPAGKKIFKAVKKLKKAEKQLREIILKNVDKSEKIKAVKKYTNALSDVIINKLESEHEKFHKINFHKFYRHHTGSFMSPPCPPFMKFCDSAPVRGRFMHPPVFMPGEFLHGGNFMPPPPPFMHNKSAFNGNFMPPPPSHFMQCRPPLPPVYYNKSTGDHSCWNFKKNAKSDLKMNIIEKEKKNDVYYGRCWRK